MLSLDNKPLLPLIVHRGRNYRCLEQETPDYAVRIYEPHLLDTELSGSAIAMVHGMEEGWDVWEHLLWNLDLGLRNFGVDMPWSGARGHRWGIHVSAAEWVRQGLELIPTDVSVIFAHSLGANAVLEHINIYGTGSLRAIVLVSPFYRARYEQFDWAFVEYYVRHFSKFLEMGLRARNGTDRLSSETLEIMAEKVRDQIGPLGLLQFLSIFCRTPALVLEKFKIPIFIIGGDKDIGCFPEDCISLANALPQASVKIFPDCGHSSMLEKSEEMLSLIREFLKPLVYKK